MIELISTGSELLTGKLNTNASAICERLALCGVAPSFITTVKDNRKDFNMVLKTAFSRANAVIITGGLGPTFDDITVECVAAAVGAAVITDEAVLKKIQAHFEARGLGTMPAINKKQAEIIKGAKVINNPNGTAPGQMFHFEYLAENKKLRKTVFLLPGPPREMLPMFEATVLPFFKSYKADITKSLTFKICGLPESRVDEMVSPAVSALSFGENVKVETAITAHGYIVSFKVIVSADNEMLADESLNNIKLEIENILGENVFGYNNDTLENVLGARLLKLNKKVAVAESCTGGMIAERITSAAGSSAYFGYGVVSYSNEAKQKILGINETTLNAHGAVSAETALEMAESVLKLSGADYGISATGIAGPAGATKEKPVGLVYIALAVKGKGAQVRENMFYGTREDIRERAATVALNMLLKEIK